MVLQRLAKPSGVRPRAGSSPASSVERSNMTIIAIVLGGLLVVGLIYFLSRALPLE